MKQRNGTAEQPLYVICRSGSRSAKACQKFLDAGYRNAVNVEGGTQAWDAAGLPVVRGRKAMSLERQVRIAAGAIVLLGAILSYFVHPYFNADFRRAEFDDSFCMRPAKYLGISRFSGPNCHRVLFIVPDFLRILSALHVAPRY